MSQPTGTILINTSLQAVNPTNTNATYINPIRSDTFSNVLGYNTTSKEIVYSAKTFVIEHPLNDEQADEKFLVHACLEGPEAGVYYRGEGIITNDSFTIVQLPNYVSKLAHNFTINITPIYDEDVDEFVENKNYYAGRIMNNSFKVYGKNGSFYWCVFGERASINVEPFKRDVSVKGDGPYRWI